jgi:hypothetical protein
VVSRCVEVSIDLCLPSESEKFLYAENNGISICDTVMRFQWATIRSGLCFYHGDTVGGTRALLDAIQEASREDFPWQTAFSESRFRNSSVIQFSGRINGRHSMSYKHLLARLDEIQRLSAPERIGSQARFLPKIPENIEIHLAVVRVASSLSELRYSSETESLFAEVTLQAHHGLKKAGCGSKKVEIFLALSSHHQQQDKLQDSLNDILGAYVSLAVEYLSGTHLSIFKSLQEHWRMFEQQSASLFMIDPAMSKEEIQSMTTKMGTIWFFDRMLSQNGDWWKEDGMALKLGDPSHGSQLGSAKLSSNDIMSETDRSSNKYGVTFSVGSGMTGLSLSEFLP